MRSKVVPLAVQTGCSKGCRDRAQKLKGSRLDARAFSAFATLDPELAEKASSDAHSL